MLLLNILTKTNTREHTVWLPFWDHYSAFLCTKLLLFEMFLLVYKTLNGSGPKYTSDLLTTYEPPRLLTSSGSSLLSTLWVLHIISGTNYQKIRSRHKFIFYVIFYETYFSRIHFLAYLHWLWWCIPLILVCIILNPLYKMLHSILSYSISV